MTGRTSFHGANPGRGGDLRLFADTELGDDFAITIGVDLFQVIQKPSALAHEHQQAATRSVVLLVSFKVFGQFPDPFAQNGDLHLRGTSI